MQTDHFAFWIQRATMDTMKLTYSQKRYIQKHYPKESIEMISQRKKIPEDLSLITFGFLDVYKIIRPPITAVQLFAEKIGDKAAEMLLSKLSNNKIKIKNVIIDTLMHERESCKRI